MSKQVKDIIMRDYKARLDGADEAVLISIRGVKGTDTTKMRGALHKKKVRVTVVRNALFRKAAQGSKLAPLGDLMTGANALAYGGQSVVEVARELAGMVATYKGLELKGAILDGVLFKGKAGVEELSKFPTKDEAIAQAVTLIVSPGRKLVGQVKGPGSAIAGIIKTIEEKLEKGEAIAKKA